MGATGSRKFRVLKRLFELAFPWQRKQQEIYTGPSAFVRSVPEAGHSDIGVRTVRSSGAQTTTCSLKQSLMPNEVYQLEVASPYLETHFLR